MTSAIKPTLLRKSSMSLKNVYYAACNIHISHLNQTTKPNASSKSTIDQKDVERHTKQMSEWWQTDGPMKALHTFNLIRVPFIRDGLVEQTHEKNITPLKGKNILDVGCGGGILSEPLAVLGANVVGIDASKELIDCATQHASQNPRLNDNMPQYICTTAEEHATENENCYDGVVASEIIEHVNNKELFVKSCVQALKPGGRIFFTTPSRSRLSQFSVIFLAEYVFNMIPRGTHQLEKFVKPTELTFMLERENCHVEAIYGIFYNVLTNKWHWVKNHSLMFALQAVKCDEAEENYSK